MKQGELFYEKISMVNNYGTKNKNKTKIPRKQRRRRRSILEYFQFLLLFPYVPLEILYMFLLMVK